jgi:hypothetical protein
MTDDGGTFGRKEKPADPSVADHAQRALAQLTFGEQLIAFGAVLVLVVNLLLGEILIGEYFVSEASWLLAAAAITGIFFYYTGRPAPWHNFYPWFVEMAAWAVAAIGLVTLLDWLFGHFSPDGASLFFMLVFFAAAALFGTGAFFLRRQR